MIRSVPHLFAAANGVTLAGDQRCFYCGAPADGSHAAKEYVKDSFNGRDHVAVPSSSCVCEGCVICMRHKCELTLIDGQVKSGQMMRTYSWVVTQDAAMAATKAHLPVLRSLCLSPPEPPYALILSDSGQKHLLYRGVVCRSKDRAILTLEGDRVDYATSELQSRLRLAGKLVAATGKPALKEPPTVRFGIAVMDRYPETGERLLSEWDLVREQPLSALAAWLSPKKEECDVEYPAELAAAANDGLRILPPQTGGPDRPERPARSGGKRRAQGGVGQLDLFPC